jgi:hypothetical protein
MPEQSGVVVRVVNAQSVSAGPEKVKAILGRSFTKPGAYGRPDILLGCEGYRVNVPNMADFYGFDAVQYGHGGVTVNTALAGSFIAWRQETGDAVGKPTIEEGSPAGEGIQARYLVSQKLKVNGHRATFRAGHAPPDRAPKGQSTFLDQLRRYPGVIGLDANEREDEMDPHYARQYHGIGVLGILVPEWIPSTGIKAVDVGSDHLAGDLILWPTR